MTNLMWAGLSGGFLAACLVIAIVGAVTSSKPWHARRHGSGGLRIFSCDHCLRIWEEKP